MFRQDVAAVAAGDESSVEASVGAERLSPLIDGVEYYPALREALLRAEKQVLIVGWELHSEVALVRGDEAERVQETDGYPVVLADLLRSIVEERADLCVRLLIWEGASLFAMEREFLPRMKRPWERHERIRLEWDEDTPTLGSQHQKIVVVDDRVAFFGGMDLTKSRWDTHEHKLDDERRRKPGLWPSYSDPYHDVMLVGDGELARFLGDHARTRWLRATGERLEVPSGRTGDHDPWPASVEPVFRSRRVAVSLTEPAHDGRPEKRQVERAFLNQIEAAERFVYIETQYLASERIVTALCDRLREEGGPEVVIVLPYGCPGMLQSMAMDRQRDLLIDRLREADPGGRLGVYWPRLHADAHEKPLERSVYVHAKVMVIDDRLLRIGSANLNSRSMGLDSELDGSIGVGEGDEDARAAIARFRRRSLSYLLGVGADRVEEAERGGVSLVAAIESLRGGDRTLETFEHRAPKYVTAAPLGIRLADPERPLDENDARRVFDAIAEQTGLRQQARRGKAIGIGILRRHRLSMLAVGLLVLAVGALVFTPLGSEVFALDLGGTLESVASGPLGIAGLMTLFVLLGSIGAPITVLIVAVGAVIGTWWAAPLAVAGVMASSVAGFGVGRLAPGAVRGRFDGGGRLDSVRKMLHRHGVLAVAVVRNLPIAPFAVVNALFGVTGIGWGTYLLGTLIGMLPGVVLLSLAGKGLLDMVRNPTPARIAIFVGVVACIGAVSFGTQRLLRKYEPAEDDGKDADPGGARGERSSDDEGDVS